MTTYTTRNNVSYCSFFRFNEGYNDVFVEDDHFLYAEGELYFNRAPHNYTVKEYRPAGLDDLDAAVFNPGAYNTGFVVSAYSGADEKYLETLEPAPIETAKQIIASEERYTLECMAHSYGYTPQQAVDAYLECIDDGEDPHEALMYVACCMMEYDL